MKLGRQTANEWIAFVAFLLRCDFLPPLNGEQSELAPLLNPFCGHSLATKKIQSLGGGHQSGWVADAVEIVLSGRRQTLHSAPPAGLLCPSTWRRPVGMPVKVCNLSRDDDKGRPSAGQTFQGPPRRLTLVRVWRHLARRAARSARRGAASPRGLRAEKSSRGPSTAGPRTLVQTPLGSLPEPRGWARHRRVTAGRNGQKYARPILAKHIFSRQKGP